MQRVTSSEGYDHDVDERRRSDLDRRLRRVALVAVTLAAIATVTGFVPDGLAYWDTSWDPRPDDVHVVHATFAGGWTLVVWTALHALFARAVVKRPTRRRAILWFVTTVITTPVAFFAWAITEHGFIFDDWAARGVGHVTFACAATASALLVVVLPIVALASKRTPPPDAPIARVV